MSIDRASATASAARLVSSLAVATAGLSVLVMGSLSVSLPAMAQAARVPAAAKAAPAPVSSQPALTTASYGDWVLRCQHVDTATPKNRCEAAQLIQVQGQSAPIAQIAFGRLDPASPLRVTAVLPPNISLPSTVSLSTADNNDQGVQLSWARCLPGGCFAAAEIGEAALTRLRGATGAGRLTFVDAAGRRVALSSSFRGLAQALDALAKQD